MTMADRIAVMKDGVLQQLDSPQNLYDNPNNIFVAGFIGSPAMNFFDATVTGTRDEMYIDTGGFPPARPPADTQRGCHLGKKVIFGIRPEDIHAAQYVPSGVAGDHVRGEVDVQEIMGNEVILYMESNGRASSPAWTRAPAPPPARRWKSSSTCTTCTSLTHRPSRQSSPDRALATLCIEPRHESGGVFCDGRNGDGARIAATSSPFYNPTLTRTTVRAIITRIITQ